MTKNEAYQIMVSYCIGDFSKYTFQDTIRALSWALNQLGPPDIEHQPMAHTPLEPMELCLCEQNRVFLRPEQPYIFKVDPKCAECLRLAEYTKI